MGLVTGRSGASCVAEPLICGVCANSGECQNRTVGHPVSAWKIGEWVGMGKKMPIHLVSEV